MKPKMTDIAVTFSSSISSLVSKAVLSKTPLNRSEDGYNMMIARRLFLETPDFIVSSTKYVNIFSNLLDVHRYSRVCQPPNGLKRHFTW